MIIAVRRHTFTINNVKIDDLVCVSVCLHPDTDARGHESHVSYVSVLALNLKSDPNDNDLCLVVMHCLNMI